MFPLWLWQLPRCGDWTLASVLPQAKGRSSPNNSSVLLPNFAWFYMFFSAGQVRLSILSGCSTCTYVSDGVFLMYPWREVYCTPYPLSPLPSCSPLSLPFCTSIFFWLPLFSVKLDFFFNVFLQYTQHLCLFSLCLNILSLPLGLNNLIVMCLRDDSVLYFTAGYLSSFIYVWMISIDPSSGSLLLLWPIGYEFHHWIYLQILSF